MEEERRRNENTKTKLFGKERGLSAKLEVVCVRRRRRPAESLSILLLSESLSRVVEEEGRERPPSLDRAATCL